MNDWAPLLTIRPNLIGEAGEVQISAAMSQKRIKIRIDDVIDAIACDLDAENPVTRALISHEFAQFGTISSEIGNDPTAHWFDRNWQIALNYYLWSIRDEFLDEGDDYEEIRCNALTDMLAESPLPLPVPVCNDVLAGLPPRASLPGDRSYGEVLRERVTTLAMLSEERLSGEIFRGLLWHGFEVSRKYHVPDIEDHIHNILHGVGFAFDPYIAVFDVKGLDPGIYYYNISEDKMSCVQKGNFRAHISKGLIGHEQARTASCTVLLTVDFERFQWRYRHERALRNLYYDVGRMAQYLILIATAYGLKTHITPATVDDYLAELLMIDSDDRQVLHTITISTGQA